MMIAGIGTHILDCTRVRTLLDRHAEKFVQAMYTEQEALYCRDRTHSTEYYAAFWCMKEAVLRSLGMKWKQGICWQNVEIVCQRAIQPKVIVTGYVRQCMDRLQVQEIHASYSYCRLFATAYVIAVR